MRKPDAETMHIQLHGADLAHRPFAGKLQWLIELPPQWQWFLTWAPGKNEFPQHFKETSSWRMSSSLSSAPTACRVLVRSLQVSRRQAQPCDLELTLRVAHLQVSQVAL